MPFRIVVSTGFSLPRRVWRPFAPHRAADGDNVQMGCRQMGDLII